MATNFEIVERVGTSTVSITDAIKSAVHDARKERAVAWFEVADVRGRVAAGELEFQVTVKMGRKL